MRLACEHCVWDQLQFRAHAARPLNGEWCVCVYVGYELTLGAVLAMPRAGAVSLTRLRLGWAACRCSLIVCNMDSPSHSKP